MAGAGSASGRPNRASAGSIELEIHETGLVSKGPSLEPRDLHFRRLDWVRLRARVFQAGDIPEDDAIIWRWGGQPTGDGRQIAAGTVLKRLPDKVDARTVGSNWNLLLKRRISARTDGRTQGIRKVLSQLEWPTEWPGLGSPGTGADYDDRSHNPNAHSVSFLGCDNFLRHALIGKRCNENVTAG